MVIPLGSFYEMLRIVLKYIRVSARQYSLNSGDADSLFAKSIMHLQDDASHLTLLRVNVPD